MDTENSAISNNLIRYTKGESHSSDSTTSIQKEMIVVSIQLKNLDELTNKLNSKALVELLNECFILFYEFITKNNGFILQYVQSELIALFPFSQVDGLNSSLSILQKVMHINNQKKQEDIPSVSFGIGVDKGYITLGVIGEPNCQQVIGLGDAIGVASKLASVSKDYKSSFVVSETIYFGLDKSNDYLIRFIDRIQAKPNHISIFEIYNHEPPQIIQKRKEHAKLFENALALFHSGDIKTSEIRLKQYNLMVPEDYIAILYLERCKKDIIYQSKGSSVFQRKIMWSDYLSVYYEPIDNQHKELIGRVSNFLQNIKDGKASDETLKILSFLEDYTVKHFSTEEKIMVKNEYPFYEEHKKQHEIFINELNTIKTTGLKQEKIDFHLMLRIESQLVNWIINHICITDKKLGNFLNSRE